MGSFALDVRAWAEKSKGNCHQVVRGTVANVVRAVDMRSPVGNRELWAVNAVALQNRANFQLERERAGKPPLSKRSLAGKFPTLKPKGYVGGRFRASWQLGIDSVPLSTPFEKSPPASSYPGGEETIAAALAMIPTQAAGRVYHYANALPYAQALEDGHSSQAPEGIVALTAREFQQHVDRAVAELSK